jgi:hypothetical protein
MTLPEDRDDEPLDLSPLDPAENAPAWEARVARTIDAARRARRGSAVVWLSRAAPFAIAAALLLGIAAYAWRPTTSGQVQDSAGSLLVRQSNDDHAELARLVSTLGTTP